MAGDSLPSYWIKANQELNRMVGTDMLVKIIIDVNHKYYPPTVVLRWMECREQSPYGVFPSADEMIVGHDVDMMMCVMGYGHVQPIRWKRDVDGIITNERYMEVDGDEIENGY